MGGFYSKMQMINMIDQLNVNHKVGKIVIRLAKNNGLS